jgi:predicted short-subunit dehydrogenase-like oxidoreductase (DUF2520 family)
VSSLPPTAVAPVPGSPSVVVVQWTDVPEWVSTASVVTVPDSVIVNVAVSSIIYLPTAVVVPTSWNSPVIIPASAASSIPTD